MLVLNYNGMAHLDDCLASALVAAERYEPRPPVVLVDNRSTDGSVEFVQCHFPTVEVVVSPANDCLFSLNTVIGAREEEVVLVLNNDMRFAPDFVGPLLEHFDRADVFAAGAAIFDWTGERPTVAPRCGEVRRFWFYKWWEYERQETSPTLEACAGAVAYRRRIFVDLGGFDDLYRPGYYEDLDLSHRAWRHGWRVVYEPKSVSFHKESASMVTRFGNDGKAELLYRNHILFTVKNVGGWGFLAGFLLLLPLRAVRPALAGDLVPLRGLAYAVPRLLLALRRRLGAAASPGGRRPLPAEIFRATCAAAPMGFGGSSGKHGIG